MRSTAPSRRAAASSRRGTGGSQRVALRRAEAAAGIGLDDVVAAQVAEIGPHRGGLPGDGTACEAAGVEVREVPTQGPVGRRRPVRGSRPVRPRPRTPRRRARTPAVCARSCGEGGRETRLVPGHPGTLHTRLAEPHGQRTPHWPARSGRDERHRPPLRSATTTFHDLPLRTPRFRPVDRARLFRSRSGGPVLASVRQRHAARRRRPRRHRGGPRLVRAAGVHDRRAPRHDRAGVARTGAGRAALVGPGVARAPDHREPRPRRGSASTGAGLDVAVALGILVGVGGAARRSASPAPRCWASSGSTVRSARSPARSRSYTRSCATASTRVIVPEANAAEAALVTGIQVRAARTPRRAARRSSRASAVARLAAAAADARRRAGRRRSTSPRYAACRRPAVALEAAAAGGHHLLLSGPPGAGKTMLARRLPTILPPLDPDEALEVTRIHSAAGHAPAGGARARAPVPRAAPHRVDRRARRRRQPAPAPGRSHARAPRHALPRRAGRVPARARSTRCASRSRNASCASRARLMTLELPGRLPARRVHEPVPVRARAAAAARAREVATGALPTAALGTAARPLRPPARRAPRRNRPRRPGEASAVVATASRTRAARQRRALRDGRGSNAHVPAGALSTCIAPHRRRADAWQGRGGDRAAHRAAVRPGSGVLRARSPTSTRDRRLGRARVAGRDAP